MSLLENESEAHRPMEVMICRSVVGDSAELPDFF